MSERMLAIAYAIDPLLLMLADAESHALPGATKEGLLRARLVLTKIRSWSASKYKPVAPEEP